MVTGVFNDVFTTSLDVDTFVREDGDLSEVVSWLSSIIGDGGLLWVFVDLGFKSFVVEGGACGYDVP